mgnify:FL=1|tara:strand:+ start:1010 stop:1240 length:231 start_codon:yes stop_codon:yes gene_type:complete
MGVLACDRNGCENIMCDNVSDERKEYLCDECKQELKEEGVCCIDNFMQSNKQQPTSYHQEWEDYIDELFTNRWEGE